MTPVVITGDNAAGPVDTEALDPLQLTVVLTASTIPFVAVEIEKWWRQRQAGAT